MRAGVALLVAAMGLGSVALTQPTLARSLHAAKAREDVYLFPPPAELKVATLGYRAATVDMLWANLRVEYGMHFVEQRPFPNVTHYIDAILELEPDFEPVYRYVDTLVCYHAGTGTADDARKARAYLQRGIRERPDDHEVWLHYGQFLAFMGATYLDSQDEIEQWRGDGAAALERAVELGEDPTRSISAANLLSAHGEREAAVRALERAYALADDGRTRDIIVAKLGALHAEDVRDRATGDVAFIEQRWRARWAFTPRLIALLLGPGADPLRCVGENAAHDAHCARNWDDAVPSSKER